MATRAVELTGYAPTAAGLRLRYATGGSVDGPNDPLADVDVAESAGEVVVTVLEAVGEGDKLLMRLQRCVEVTLERPLGDRAVRDGGRRGRPPVRRSDDLASSS